MLSEVSSQGLHGRLMGEGLPYSVWAPSPESPLIIRLGERQAAAGIWSLETEAKLEGSPVADGINAIIAQW